MKLFVLALSILGAGCGDCIPSSATTPSSFAVRGPSADALVVARSAAELRAAVAKIPVSPPAPDPRVAPNPEADPAALAKQAQARLDAFVAATSFATNDVAIVRAGADRARLAGQTSDGKRVTLYYAGDCSPCSGGNPGSSEEAAYAYEMRTAERTDLVLVPKGARVAIRVCGSSCGTCPTNVP